jgi:hypothetical protein
VFGFTAIPGCLRSPGDSAATQTGSEFDVDDERCTGANVVATPEEPDRTRRSYRSPGVDWSRSPINLIGPRSSTR